MIQMIGIFTYVFLFVCYSILISHPRMEMWERILYGIMFGVSILAPLGAFYLGGE